MGKMLIGSLGKRASRLIIAPSHDQIRKERLKQDAVCAYALGWACTRADNVLDPSCNGMTRCWNHVVASTDSHELH